MKANVGWDTPGCSFVRVSKHSGQPVGHDIEDPGPVVNRKIVVQDQVDPLLKDDRQLWLAEHVSQGLVIGEDNSVSPTPYVLVKFSEAIHETKEFFLVSGIALLRSSPFLGANGNNIGRRDVLLIALGLVKDAAAPEIRRITGDEERAIEVREAEKRSGGDSRLQSLEADFEEIVPLDGLAVLDIDKRS